MIDIDQLCSPVDEANPAGPDLEYDPAFLALEIEQRGKAERQVGDSIIPAEPPDWKKVLEQALRLAERTRDLRIACSITRALTRLEGMNGLVQGLQLTDRWCREFWNCVHPLLDEEDDNDPTVRMNALAPLGNPEELLADIRDSNFVSARGIGACTVRELEVALGILSPAVDDMKTWRSTNDIDALVNAARQQGGLEQNAALRAIEVCHALSAYLSAEIGADRAIDLKPLLARLRPIAEYAKKFVVEKSAPFTETELTPMMETSANAMPISPSAMVQISAEIKSRQDASRMLDLICAYFEKNEPTNPAPLLLRRAQRLSTMNFYDIVRDIAPDAIAAVETVAGSQPEPTE